MDDRGRNASKGFRMSARRLAAWGAGAAVILTAVSTALINELHGGWRWWVAASGAVFMTAVLAGWLALRGVGGGVDQLGAGAVKAGRDIEAALRLTLPRVRCRRQNVLPRVTG
jgi:hypothetical protein